MSTAACRNKVTADIVGEERPEPTQEICAVLNRSAVNNRRASTTGEQDDENSEDA
jgi:hypothetical protein